MSEVLKKLTSTLELVQNGWLIALHAGCQDMVVGTLNNRDAIKLNET